MTFFNMSFSAQDPVPQQREWVTDREKLKQTETHKDRSQRAREKDLKSE